MSFNGSSATKGIKLLYVFVLTTYRVEPRFFESRSSSQNDFN